eukprot:10333352-Prorocentrum_lima.AAC.1
MPASLRAADPGALLRCLRNRRRCEEAARLESGLVEQRHVCGGATEAVAKIKTQDVLGSCARLGVTGSDSVESLRCPYELWRKKQMSPS